MQRNRIQINSDEDIVKLHQIANTFKGNIYVEDLNNCRINAKSLLGLFATKDFNSLYLVSEEEVPYNIIKDFLI